VNIIPWLFLLVVAAFLIGIWLALSRFRGSKHYPLIWATTVLLLTAWWGSALVNLIHTHLIHMHSGLPDSNYEILGAGSYFSFLLLLFSWTSLFYSTGREKAHVPNNPKVGTESDPPGFVLRLSYNVV
jgi:hypothetical protein